MRINWLFCGCGCGAVKTFDEEQSDTAEAAANTGSRNSSDGPRDAASSCSSSNQLQPDALLLAFERLPDQELYSTVTAVNRTWQTAAAAALGTRAITIHNLPALSCKAASALAWLTHYSSSIHELHIHHAELHPTEWSTLLSLPFPKLAKLQLNRCRLGDCSSEQLQLLSQLTNLQRLSSNYVAPELSPSCVAKLGTSLIGLTGLELKSCGLGGGHLQELTPLVQGGLCCLDLFDNPGIGKDVDSSNRALQMWAGAAAAAASCESTAQADEDGLAASSAGAQADGAGHLQASRAAPAGNAEAAKAGGSSSQPEADLDQQQQQQQRQQQEHMQEHTPRRQLPAMLTLRQLQLSYCGIRHLPQLAQLTSLTSLNLQENKCDAETVEATGQLQQLQELVLEEAVGAATPPSAFAALAGLTNLELLDISGGPTGCLEELFGSATDGTLPAPPKDAAQAATTGWHGLRVKWSGKGRAPAGFRMPQQRRTGSSSSSRCSSPRVTRSSGEFTPAGCMSRSSLDMVGGLDGAAAVLPVPAPMGCAPAAAAGARLVGTASTAGGEKVALDDTAAAAETVVCRRSSTESVASVHASSGAAAKAIVPAASTAAGCAATCDASAGAESPVASVTEGVASGRCSGSGCLAEEGGCGCSCSALPRLRRLEAEQVGVSDSCISSIVHCCSQLQDLDISHNHVGADGIVLLHALTSLTHLNISCQQPNLSDAAAAALVQLRQLRGLDVGGNSFSKPSEVQLQLQREDSGVGGKLVRLTGCGMRSEVGEPWEWQQQQQQMVGCGKQGDGGGDGSNGGASRLGSPKKQQQQQQQQLHLPQH